MMQDRKNGCEKDGPAPETGVELGGFDSLSISHFQLCVKSGQRGKLEL
jgi:hypothetical protein